MTNLDEAVKRVTNWANLAEFAGHGATAYRTTDGEVHLLLVSDLDTILAAVNNQEEK